MDLIGIEPMTSSMPWKRAPSCATGPHAAGMQLLHCHCSSGIRQTGISSEDSHAVMPVMMRRTPSRKRVS